MRVYTSDEIINAMSRSRYSKQGSKYGNCVPIALENIFKHYGVDINFTNRDLLEWGYIPKVGGDPESIFFKAGVSFRKLPRKSLHHKKIKNVISEGLDKGKIYAISSRVCGEGHVYLITKKVGYGLRNEIKFGDNFTMRSARTYFLAINRRAWAKRFERIHSLTYGQENKYDMQFIDNLIICGDVGIFNKESNSKVYEIDGIIETKKNKRVYTLNSSLHNLLKFRIKYGRIPDVYFDVKLFLQNGNYKFFTKEEEAEDAKWIGETYSELSASIELTTTDGIPYRRIKEDLLDMNLPMVIEAPLNRGGVKCV